MTIQTMSKHFMSPSLYLEQQATDGMDKVGQESEVALKITIYFRADF